MLLWKFATFVTHTGRANVQAQIDSLSDYGLEDFSAAVRVLATQPMHEWLEPHGKKLKGKKELYEIRFLDARTQTRALGHFAGDTFVITVICTHKQRVYDPPDAIDSAEKRRDRLLQGEGSTAPLQIDGEDFPPVR